MEKILTISDRKMGIYEGYLNEVFDVFKDTGKAEIKPTLSYTYYFIERPDDGESKYIFKLDDTFAEFVKTFDHDCRASGGDDGCGYCDFLFDLGLLTDFDVIDNTEESEE